MDGNLTARVVVSGLQQVDTSRPTAPASPYLLRYDCTDAAGNSAQPVFRNVSVICPGAEVACAGSDGALSCSTNGYCLVSGTPTGETYFGLASTCTGTHRFSGRACQMVVDDSMSTTKSIHCELHASSTAGNSTRQC
jgi:hypothetical protein